MSDFLGRLRARRNELAAPGGELTDSDFDSPLPNESVSAGKAAIQDLLQNPDKPQAPDGPSFEERIAARRAQLEQEGAGLQAGSRVIATTSDGGKIVEDDRGNRSFSSPGYSTRDPDRIAQILEGATPAEASTSSFNESIIAENPVASRAVKFVEGTPFAGSYLDEAADAVLGEDAGDAIRATSRAMEQERPGQSLALGFGGALTGGAGMGAAALPAAAPLLKGSAFMRASLASIAGGTAGGIEGGIYGAGQQDGEGRLENAKTGAMWGAGLGGLAAGGGSFLSSGIEGLAKKLKKLDLSVIQAEFGLSKPAAKAVKAALDGEDLDAASRALRGLGDEAMLADSGPAAGAMLDAVAQTGGPALRATRDAVEGRIERMAPKLRSALNLAFGKPQGTREAMTGIAKGSAQIRKSAYNKAFGQAIDYAGEKGRAIEAVLDRVPNRTLTAAIEEANEAMTAAGVRNQQIMAEIAEDGAVTFREMPNVQQVHEIKRALQDIAQRETDSVTGQVSSRGLRAKNLARDLRVALEEAAPSYRAASRLGGDKIAEQGAFQIGQRLFQPRTTLEDVREALSEATPAARKAAKDGIRNYLENALSHVRTTLSDNSTEAREALHAIRLFSSRGNRQKLAEVVGVKNAERVLAQIDQTAQAFELRAMVAQNSKTASRQALQGQVSELAQPNALATLAQGDVGLSAKKVARFLTGASADMQEKAKRELYGEIATALTKRRGPEAERALKLVQSAMEGQVLKDEEAELIARLVANPMAISGDQFGREQLAR